MISQQNETVETGEIGETLFFNCSGMIWFGCGKETANTVDFQKVLLFYTLFPK